MGFWKKAGLTYLGANVVAGAFLFDAIVRGDLREEFHIVADVRKTENDMNFAITQDGVIIPFSEANVGDEVCATHLTFGPISGEIIKFLGRAHDMDGPLTITLPDGFAGVLECGV